MVTGENSGRNLSPEMEEGLQRIEEIVSVTHGVV